MNYASLKEIRGIVMVRIGKLLVITLLFRRSCIRALSKVDRNADDASLHLMQGQPIKSKAEYSTVEKLDI